MAAPASGWRVVSPGTRQLNLKIDLDPPVGASTHLEVLRLALGLAACQTTPVGRQCFIAGDGGTAWGTGRGDRIASLHDLEEGEFWLVTPPVEVATAEVFERYTKLTQRATPSSIVRLVQGGAGYSADGLEGFNDLEADVLQHYPVIRKTRAALMEAGGAPVRLSGSGGTLYTFFSAPIEIEANGERALRAVDPRVHHRVESKFHPELCGKPGHLPDFVLVRRDRDGLQLEGQPSVERKCDAPHTTIKRSRHGGQPLVGFTRSSVERDLEGEGAPLGQVVGHAPGEVDVVVDERRGVGVLGGPVLG